MIAGSGARGLLRRRFALGLAALLAAAPASAEFALDPPRIERELREMVDEDGRASKLFWVDPLNDMAVVFLTQKVEFDGTLRHDIRDAVYGAAYQGR